MSKSLNFRTAAQLDVFEQQNWYVEQLAFDAAHRFGQAVANLIDRLIADPGTGRKEPEFNASLLGLRSSAVVGFETIRMYYIDRLNSLDIIRVLHTSRDVEAILTDEANE